MPYEWLHSHALIHVQTINQRIICHSELSSVIQLHVQQQTNHRIQIKVLTFLLQLFKMISSLVYKQAMISTPIETILFTEAYRSRWRPILCEALSMLSSQVTWSFDFCDQWWACHRPKRLTLHMPDSQEQI